MYRKQLRRRRAVLALLVVSSFALLTATYGDQSGALQRGIGAVFSPLQEGADRALKPARDLVNWFDETFDARGENERLEDQLADLSARVAGADTAIAENDQFRELLELQNQGLFAGYDAVTARVIGRSPTVWYSSVRLDKGTSSGVEVDDPVVGPQGLAGRVTSATAGTSVVTLITDSTSGVSAKVVPTGIQGVIQPEVGDPGDLVLDFIDADEPVRRGDMVVTAGWRGEGLSSLFPVGIPIGTVSRATASEQEASQQVHVRALVDLSNLDYLRVLTGGGSR